MARPRTEKTLGMHRTNLLESLANPDTVFPPRQEYSELMGLAHPSSVYQIFTPGQLTEIEKEALALRRSKYSGLISKVDRGLMARAAKGDSAAAKLVFQRFEGWSERVVQEHVVEEETIESIIHHLTAKNNGNS